MDRLDQLAEQLRRQREDLQKQFDESSVSKGETSRLLDKIEELRRRSEATRPQGEQSVSDRPAQARDSRGGKTTPFHAS